MLRVPDRCFMATSTEHRYPGSHWSRPALRLQSKIRLRVHSVYEHVPSTSTSTQGDGQIPSFYLDVVSPGWPDLPPQPSWPTPAAVSPPVSVLSCSIGRAGSDG